MLDDSCQRGDLLVQEPCQRRSGILSLLAHALSHYVSIGLVHPYRFVVKGKGYKEAQMLEATVDVDRYSTIKDQVHGRSIVRQLNADDVAKWSGHLRSSQFGLQDAIDALKAGMDLWELDVQSRIQAIYVCLPNAASTWHRFKFERCIARVVALMETLGSTTPLSYIIIPTASLRTWPPRGAPVEASHINGAFTYRGPAHNGLVIVHRYEEYPKVMLHEALHHTRIDPMANAHAFHVGKVIIPNVLWSEAVVEAFADVYNVCFVAAESGMKVNALIEKERRHAAHMAACVLQRIRSQGGWTETTNAFAYVVIRHIILENGYFGLAALERDLKTWSYGTVIAKFADVGTNADKSMRLTIFGDC